MRSDSPSGNNKPALTADSMFSKERPAVNKVDHENENRSFARLTISSAIESPAVAAGLGAFST
jgi:hypothetical protein